MGEEDFPLPALTPHLKLSRAPDDKGEPAYTLHNPVSNSYFKIDWPAFEILSRMPQHASALSLKNSIERETTLKITIDQIKDIVVFLEQNALLALRDQNIQNVNLKNLPLWKKIFHQYLYFSLPLFKPQAFLERTYKYIDWIHNPLFLKGMMLFLVVMVLATLPRMDEFFHTFSGLVSAEGAISVLIVFSAVKIVHEFAHAYTAIRYGVKVPHMGIAFMVMYPVLYTETTGSWSLPSRRARFHIGMAGILAELCLAAVFLTIWHLSTTGSMMQSISFLVVTVSLVGSLLINLNPLMRFDGYYMFSDATGFDNLQNRACAFARHSLRKKLFGWNDAAPEDLPPNDQRFLTNFGFALLIYRFFLFLGIAILVYHVFFQPIGFILMMAELIWFIFLPIWSELKIWWKNKDRIFASKRSIMPTIILVGVAFIIFIPWKTTVVLPAIIHAGSHESIYPPSPAKIMSLNVQNGEEVQAGQVLATLESPELDHQIKSAKHELNSLETLRRRGQNMVQTLQNNQLSDVAIEKARLKLKSYEEQKQRLIIKAPFTGTVRDLSPEISEGRYVMPLDALFTLVDPQSTSVTAYATEDAREKISGSGTAIFLSEYRSTRVDGLIVESIADTGNMSVPWAELSSLHGGSIASEPDAEGGLVSRRALYEVTVKSSHPAPSQAQRGYLYVSSHPSSIFMSWIKGLISIIRHETNLG